MESEKRSTVEESIEVIIQIKHKELGNSSCEGDIVGPCDRVICGLCKESIKLDDILSYIKRLYEGTLNI